MLGKGFSERMITLTKDPFVGLFIGILATSIVQSSSAVTSMVVVAAQAGNVTIAGAVPIVMGANIGTSVTNLLVSFSLITRSAEYRRGFAGAIVHDLFNLCAVAVLFPLELATGILHKMAVSSTSFLAGAGGLKFTGAIKAAVKPVSGAIVEAWKGAVGPEHQEAAGIALVVISLILLFTSLFLITRLMRSAVLIRLERFLRRYLFRNAAIAFLFGAVLTAIVQSSSVTTSAVVPLVGAGLLTLRHIYPYTLGANIGTTITAMLAAFVEAGKEVGKGAASAGPAGVTVALCHLFFNLAGTAIFYPLRIIPISLAERLAEIAARRKIFGLVYVLVIFFVVPAIMIVLSKLLSRS